MVEFDHRRQLAHALACGALAVLCAQAATGQVARIRTAEAACGIGGPGPIGSPGDKASFILGPEALHVQLIDPLPSFAYFAVISPTMPVTTLPTCLRLDLEGAVVVPMAAAPRSMPEAVGATEKEREVLQRMLSPMAEYRVPYAGIPEGQSVFAQVVGVFAFADGSIYTRGSKVVEVAR
jgi:hypothetical protein